MLKKSLLREYMVPLFLAVLIIFAGCSNPAGDTITNQGTTTEDNITYEVDNTQSYYVIPPELIPFADIDTVGWAYIGSQSEDNLSVKFDYAGGVKQITFFDNGPGTLVTETVNEITGDKLNLGSPVTEGTIYIEGYGAVSYTLTGTGGETVLVFTEGIRFPENLLGKPFVKKFLNPELKGKIFAVATTGSSGFYRAANFNPGLALGPVNSIFGANSATNSTNVIEWWTLGNTRELYVEIIAGGGGTTINAATGPFASGTSVGAIQKLGEYTYSAGTEEVTLNGTTYTGFVKEKRHQIFNSPVWADTTAGTTNYLFINDKTLSSNISGLADTNIIWYGHTNYPLLYYVNGTLQGTEAAYLDPALGNTDVLTAGTGTPVRAITPARTAAIDFGTNEIWGLATAGSGGYASYVYLVDYDNGTKKKIKFGNDTALDTNDYILYERIAGSTRELYGFVEASPNSIRYLGDYTGTITDGFAFNNATNSIGATVGTLPLVKLAKGGGGAEYSVFGSILNDTKWASDEANAGTLQVVALNTGGVIYADGGAISGLADGSGTWYYNKQKQIFVFDKDDGKLSYLGPYNENYWQKRGTIGGAGAGTSVLGAAIVSPIEPFTADQLAILEGPQNSQDPIIWADDTGANYYYAASVSGTRKRYFAGSNADNNYGLYIGPTNEWYAVSGAAITYFGIADPLTGTPATIAFTGSNGAYNTTTLNKLTVGIDNYFTTSLNAASGGWVGGTAGGEKFIKLTAGTVGTDTTSYTARYTVNTLGIGSTFSGKVYSRDPNGTGAGSTANELYILDGDNILQRAVFADNSIPDTVQSITFTPTVLTKAVTMVGTPFDAIGTDIFLDDTGATGYIYIEGVGTSATLRYGTFAAGKNANSDKTLDKYFYNAEAGDVYTCYLIDGDVVAYLGNDFDASGGSLVAGFGLDDLDNPQATTPAVLKAPTAGWATILGARLEIVTATPNDTLKLNGGTAYPVYVVGSGTPFKLYYKDGKVFKYAGSAAYDTTANISVSLEFTGGTIDAVALNSLQFWALENAAVLEGEWLLDSGSTVAADGITIAGSTAIGSVQAYNILLGSSDAAGGTFAHGAADATGRWWSIKTDDNSGTADEYYIFFMKKTKFTVLPRIEYTAGGTDDITFDVAEPIKAGNVKFEQQP